MAHLWREYAGTATFPEQFWGQMVGPRQHQQRSTSDPDGQAYRDATERVSFLYLYEAEFAAAFVRAELRRLQLLTRQRLRLVQRARLQRWL